MFKGRFTTKGGLHFGKYEVAKLKEFIRENPTMPFELNPLFPESKKQRAFFEGAICPLIAFYQEGMDHRSSKDVKAVREWLKIEFNGEMINIGGTAHKVAKSTKRMLNQGFLERVEEYLQENYSPPTEALNPDKYKHWRDTIYPFGGPETYIDYLVEIGILK